MPSEPSRRYRPTPAPLLIREDRGFGAFSLGFRVYEFEGLGFRASGGGFAGRVSGGCSGPAGLERPSDFSFAAGFGADHFGIFQ